MKEDTIKIKLKMQEYELNEVLGLLQKLKAENGTFTLKNVNKKLIENILERIVVATKEECGTLSALSNNFLNLFEFYKQEE